MNNYASRDPLCRFYTPRHIGDLLMAELSDHSPGTIVDVASGTGMLGQAAQRIWRDAELTSVDIDAGVAPYGRTANLSHITADALDVNLPHVIRNPQGFDLALCNPPFQRQPWQSAFERILEEAELGSALEARVEGSMEAIFVAQNIRLTRQGGRIGLILPDGLMTGTHSASFRRALLNEHSIESAVQLPRGIFRRTDAQTYILIIKKGQSSFRPIPVRRLTIDGSFSPTLLLDQSQAEKRIDYTYHFLRYRSRGFSLSDIGAEVTRGSIEPRAGQANVANVFHTSSFPSKETERLVRLGAQGAPGMINAEPGDILLARVDRNFHQKICLVVSGSIPLTSSVLRIRTSAKYRPLVLSALLSVDGQSQLQAISRGVGPRMISKRELINMPLLNLFGAT